MEIVKLYYPLLFIVIMLLVAFRIRKREGLKINIPVSLGSILKFPIEIDNIIVFRLLLCFSIFPTLITYSLYDYSKFFPKHLTMQVFYDKEGIMKNLKDYSKKELSEMNVDVDFATRDTFYFRSLDNEIRNSTSINCFFSNNCGDIHSDGETSFIVNKIGVFQRYQVTESSGFLLHEINNPDSIPKTIKSYFNKMVSPYDYIQISIFDLFKGYITIRPEFMQIIAEKNKSDGARYNHRLCGLTRVKVFPYPEFSNTIYLLKYNDRFIPVGYAIYK